MADSVLEYMLERDWMISGGIPAQAVQIYWLLMTALSTRTIGTKTAHRS